MSRTHAISSSGPASPRTGRVGPLAALATLGVLGLLTGQTSCSQTPPPTPVRSFERPERIDFVCVQVRDVDGGNLIPKPVPADLSRCTPLSANEAADAVGDARAFHLFGLVTQTSRGEVAVADLTRGQVVDQDREAPSINFLSVGALPRDLASTPDGRLTFVTSAEASKPGLFAIASEKMLGDDQGTGKTSLTTWPSCSLPGAPTSVAVLFEEGLAAAGKNPADSRVAVLIPGTAGNRSKIVTMDVKPFLRGAGIDAGLPPGPSVEPGSLGACPVVSVIELGGPELVPASVPRGPAWDDGVKYRAGAPALPDPGPFPAGESAVERLRFANSCYPSPGKLGTPASVDLKFAEPLVESRATRFVKDGRRLYVADSTLPIIHVVDLSDPAAPKELPPLVTSSLQEPSRMVTVKDLAVSPETREYKRFLYAVDAKKGSLLVYDVTSDSSPRVPLTRPHAQSNPFQSLDRIDLEAPVVAVQFARHEAPISGRPRVTGALCNPNPGAGNDPGRDLLLGEDPRQSPELLGPTRLRGIFALATLSNGRVVTLDVDDWDAPCRRPALMTSESSATTPAEPTLPTDPYGAPGVGVGATGVGVGGTTNEAYFPVAAPHRPRSEFFLASTAREGRHQPYLQNPPQLVTRGDATLPTKGTEGNANPKMLVPGSPSANAEVGLSLSLEDPTVHIDQDWVTAYEGSLPSLDGALASITTDDDFKSLTFSAEGAHFCGHGVEDFDLGRERAQAISSSLVDRELPPIPNLGQRMTDYVEIVDDLLPPTDPYWLEDQACWTDELAKGQGTATSRFNACNAFFDGDFEPPPEVNAEPLPNPNRHLPILSAFDGKLVVSRFFSPNAATPRAVVPAESSNKKSLALAKCCFHNQAHFRVRAASQWITKGATRDRAPVQFLHHVVRGANDRCVQSCETREQLLNGRAPALPYLKEAAASTPGRTSPLAMRNPMFSFVILNGRAPDGGDQLPVFESRFKFSTRGQFVAQTRNIAATSTAVSPRSMRYVGPLGQMAIIDGASQGLVLFDLRTVSLARTAFY